MTTVAILAGGASVRMGGAKCARPLAGRPLLQWVVDAADRLATQIIICASADQGISVAAARAPVSICRDALPNLGPLAGIGAALAHAAGPIIVVPCDAPLVRPALLSAMLDAIGDADVLIPEANGRLQTAVGVWTPRAAVAVERALGSDDRSLHGVVRELHLRVFAEAEVRRVDPELVSFLNVNTPDDLATMEARVAAGTLDRAHSAAALGIGEAS